MNSGNKIGGSTINSDELATKGVNDGVIKVIELLSREKDIEHSWSLSYLDIAMICQNAYCLNECMVFPATEVDPNIPHIMITRERDSIVFQHLINTFQRKGDEKSVQILEKTGIASLTKDMYNEYIEVIRLASAFLYNNQNVFLHQAIDVVAGLSYLQKKYHNRIELIPNAPMLSIKEIGKESISLNYLNRNIRIPLEENKDVYIAGAGITSIGNIFNISSRNETHKVIFNDKNPFTAGVLRKVARYYGANSVEVTEGDFANIKANDNSIGIMILSLIHIAGPENIERLAECARVKMATGGKVVVFTPTQAPFEGDISSEQMIDCFQKNGFDKIKCDSINYELLGDVLSQTDAISMLTEKTSQEIIDILSDKLTAPKKANTMQGEFMIFELRK